MKKLTFPRLYGWLTASALVVAAVCLMAQCYGIYRAGAFTPEAVAQAFRPIAFPVCLALGLSLGSIPVNLFGGAEKEKLLRCKPTPLPASLPGWLRYAALGAGIALAAFGYFTGGTLDVLTKAVNICTECVGLG